MATVRLRTLAAGLIVAAAAGCGDSRTPPGPTGPPPSQPIAAPPAGIVSSTGVLVGAGDIAMCGSQGTEGTADLIDLIDGTVFTAGDNAYFQGTAQQYRQCYDPTWGRHKGRTRPAPGNHEYETDAARAYFDYFGASAGPPGRGYYSFKVGPWHVVSMNSNVPAGEGSAQLQWLRDDLAATDARCVAAIWHHPLFSSGQNGPQPMMRAVWRVLRELGADLVIAGHDHIYERFARQDEAGRGTSSGLRSFVVGTGGAEQTRPLRQSANSEMRAITSGVLKLTLSPETYSWQFLSVPPDTFTDSGSDSCR
jgi:acid phosphatase type 7